MFRSRITSTRFAICLVESDHLNGVGKPEGFPGCDSGQQKAARQDASGEGAFVARPVCDPDPLVGVSQVFQSSTRLFGGNVESPPTQIDACAFAIVISRGEPVERIV